MPWSEIAWNGLRFMAPLEWHVSKIGARYLMLEDDSGPVLEVKWQQVKGSFSHGAQLRRLRAAQREHVSEPLQGWDLPTSWSEALQRCQTSGFRWRGKTVGGVGIIVFCPVCRTATVVQFYQRGWGVDDRHVSRVLSTLRCHRSDRLVRWAMFDIGMSLPDRFQLVSHHFKAGQFKLRFRHRLESIRLFRWGPASILLPEGELIGFAEQQFGPPPSGAQILAADPGSMLDWEVSRSSSWCAGWDRIRRRPSNKRYRLWHLAQQNRILAVAMASDRPVERTLFESICNSYESF